MFKRCFLFTELRNFMTYDFLIVYNTCGIRSDNTDHYIKCIQSIINSKTNYKVKIAMSSCLNSKFCRDSVRSKFGDDVEIIEVDKPYTVNITFNNCCKKMIQKYGSFKGYLYLDSGVDFIGNEDALQKGFDSFLSNQYGILSFQVSNDHGLFNAKADFPVKDRNHLVPLGGSVNGHADIFSHSIYEKFNNLWPDVFAAYCTESTFSFLCAANFKRWAVLCDVILNHNKSVDGASISVPHISIKNNTPWNNLLFDRDAMEFINDPECIKCGLGYEECNKIMLHNPNAYDDSSMPLDSKTLSECIQKYFYLSKQELNYNNL